MSKKEDALTGAATSARAETATMESAVSVVDFNMERGRTQGRIERLLRNGELNAIRTVDLINLAGLNSPRELRAEIERERADGALILSTVRHRGGYYLPNNDPAIARKEIAAFIATVSSRAIASQRTLKSARRALRECQAQLRMEV